MDFLRSLALTVWTFVLTVLDATWDFAVEAAPFLLLGFALAGAIQVFLRRDRLVRWIGRPGIGSVIRASAVGVPLPLCSCGVVPVAAALRKQGADRGATTSFLISTPESGVDSIAISWALLDPLMTVFRPVAAFVAAVVGGVAQHVFGKPETVANDNSSVSQPTSCCSGGAAKQSEATSSACCGGDAIPASDTAPSFGTRVRAGARFAFIELFDDIGVALLAGLLLSGAIMAFVPDVDLAALGAWGGLVTMLLMLVVGVPVYVCATAATPLAAVMIAKGVSPGAVLVFLMAGPATNLAALAMLAPILGRRALAIYVGSVMVTSVALGLALDALYPLLGILPGVALEAASHAHEAHDHSTLSQVFAALMLLLAASGAWRRWWAKRLRHAAEAESANADAVGDASSPATDPVGA